MSLISCAQMVGNPVMAPAPAAPPSKAPPAFSRARREGPFAFARAPETFSFAGVLENPLSLAMIFLPARNALFARTVVFTGCRRRFVVSHLRSRTSQRKKIGNTNSLYKAA